MQISTNNNERFSLKNFKKKKRRKLDKSILTEDDIKVSEY